MSESKRWDFFKEGDTAFGLFYPEHYTLAAFPDRAAADRAVEDALAGGFDAEDVRAVDGRFLVESLESQRKAGLLDALLAKLSEIVGTEAAFIDLDQEHAEAGAAFVFFYTPETEQLERIKPLLDKHRALYARRYLPLAIERLVEPAGTRH